MAEARHVQQRMVRRGDVNMRLIINHAHKHLRFMDFRVGNYDQKRAFLDKVAGEHKLNKVFTLVEKQDSQNWRAATFVKEGVFPSFFRTADAHVMSRLYGSNGRPLPASASPKRGEDPKLPEGYETPRTPAGAKLEMLRQPDAVHEVLDAVDQNQLTVPFSRIVQPDLLLKGAARSIHMWLAAEVEDSFGHSILGMSLVPTNITGRGLTRIMLETMCETLVKRSVNNCFMLVRVSDTEKANLLMDMGFRVTARLQRHLGDGAQGELALVWHLRLAPKTR